MKRFAAFFQNLLSNCVLANASAINFASTYHSFIQLTDLKQIVQSFIIRSSIKGNFAITGKKPCKSLPQRHIENCFWLCFRDAILKIACFVARPIENSLSELSLVILSRGPFENLKLCQLLAVLLVLSSACEQDIVVVDFCELPSV